MTWIYVILGIIVIMVILYVAIEKIIDDITNKMY